MHQPPSNPGGYGAPPPSHQGYPPPGYPQPGYGPPGYGPGAPPPKKGLSKGMIALIVIGAWFGSCVVLGAINSGNKSESSSAPAGGNATPGAKEPGNPRPAGPTPKPAPTVALPPSQQAFYATVVQYAAAYKDAATENELKRSKIRSERRAALAPLPANVQGWVGTISNLSTNSEGKAVLSVRLPCDENVRVEVKTWNNALSDTFDNTLIPQSSKLYDTLADTGKGKLIRFSGTFIGNDDQNGFREASMSERGSMTSPEFIFRFSQASAGGS